MIKFCDENRSVFWRVNNVIINITGKKKKKEKRILKAIFCDRIQFQTIYQNYLHNAWSKVWQDLPTQNKLR